jgi:hypothetical protein
MSEQRAREGVDKYIEDLREQGARDIDSMEHGDSYVISVAHPSLLDLIRCTSYDYELIDDVPDEKHRRRVMLKTK